MKNPDNKTSNYDESLSKSYDKLYYTLVKKLYEWKDYRSIQQIKQTYQWKKYMDKVNHGDRLNPSGKERGIMFIGINPGIASNLKNVWEDPFGKFFKSLLDEAGIDKKKDEIWMTNLYKKRSPGNRPLTDHEIVEGKKELMYEIGFVRPIIIVPMGSQVIEVFDSNLNDYKNWKTYQTFGLPHPSVLRYKPEKRSEYINNLIKIKSYYDRRKEDKDRILDRKETSVSNEE